MEEYEMTDAARIEKNAIISAKLLKLMFEHQAAVGCDRGVSLRWAYDQVFGVGAFAEMASNLYDDLRAKAGVA